MEHELQCDEIDIIYHQSVSKRLQQDITQMVNLIYIERGSPTPIQTKSPNFNHYF